MVFIRGSNRWNGRLEGEETGDAGGLATDRMGEQVSQRHVGERGREDAGQITVRREADQPE